VNLSRAVFAANVTDYFSEFIMYIGKSAEFEKFSKITVAMIAGQQSLSQNSACYG